GLLQRLRRRHPRRHRRGGPRRPAGLRRRPARRPHRRGRRGLRRPPRLGGGARMSRPPVLAMRGIDKSFLGVPVLRSVDLVVEPGEVHALVGENGAGKSTLMKILAGVHSADAGTLELDGRPVAFTHPLQAQQAGIATVFQEFNLLPELSVAENIHLGREPRRRGLIDRRAMAERTAALLADLGVDDLTPAAKVKTLSVPRRQIVEIAKAMSQGAHLICMDEPTAALADAEVALLYRLVERLRDRGVSILYVSHRLREI